MKFNYCKNADARLRKAEAEAEVKAVRSVPLATEYGSGKNIEPNHQACQELFNHKSNWMVL